MKKTLISLIMVFGVVFCALPAFANATQNAETPTVDISDNILADVGPCPPCSGENPIVTGATFLDGTICTCTGTTSLVIGPDVDILTGANVTFESRKITFKSGVNIQEGAYVSTVYIKDPATVALTVEPVSGEILADGSSKAKVYATVKDANGNDVKDGTQVLFTTTKGAIFASGSTSNGVASTTLTSSATAETATITATAGTASNTIDVDFVATVSGISLSANPGSLIINGQYSVITATLIDHFGDPSPQNTQVTLTTTLGTFSNNQSITVLTLDSNGKTSVFLKSSTTGTAQVTATAKGTTSNTVNVVFYDQAPNNIILSANPTSLPADGAGTSEVKAVVSYGSGSAVPDGTAVNFEISTGTGTLSSASATTVNGIANVTYTASIVAAVINTVTASTGNGVTANANIELTGPQVATVTLTANPNILPANGTSSSVITATVAVEGGSFAANIPVTFTIKSGGGTFSNGLKTIEANTGTNGKAVVTLLSDTHAGIATLSAAAGGVSAQSIELTYQPGTLTLTIAPSTVLATGEEECVVTVLVEDADSQPVANQQIDLSLSDGTLGAFDDSQPTTGADGEATAVFTAGRKGGTVTVTATWDSSGTDVTGEGTITIQPSPSFMQVASGYPNPAAVSIRGTGGQSTSQVVFDAKDTSGNLVVDGYRVDFSILSGPNGGEEVSPLFAVTSGGKVSTILRSGFKSGPVSIKAAYQNDTNVSPVTGQITIVAGPPVGEEFGVSAEYINISGLSRIGLRDLVSLSVGDIYGNAVPDNTAVSFKTYNTGGQFSPGSGFTTGGFTSNDLVSVSSPTPQQGFVSVTGEAINGGRTTHVTCISVDSEAPNYIYAGTDGGGVYKSNNYGATWSNISRSSSISGQNWIDPYVNDLAVDPDNTNTIYAATGYLGQGHVYRSLDGGATWNSNNVEEFAGVVTTNSAVLSVVCDDGSDYVWIGTNGSGALFSTDGENFEAGGEVTPKAPTQETVPGIFDNPANGNTGTMTKPTLSDVPRTESWTLTYVVPVASATVPAPYWLNTGNGFMSNVTTDPAATLTESWTVTCTDISAGAGNEKWNVTGSVSGAGVLATTGGEYTFSGITFTIHAGGVAFAVDDQFNFSTTAAETPYWTVTGSLSGTQWNRAYNDVAYTSDKGELQFTVIEGAPAYAQGDSYTFEVTESGLGHGKVVRDIVRAPSTHGSTAVLYAGASTGVFRSEDGGQVWTRPGVFTGNNITILALHPSSTGGATDVLYAGTLDAGVWVSTDSGNTWTQYISGLGKGLSASTPVASVANTGTGVMSAVTVGDDAQSEFWTVTCTVSTPGAGTFSVTGSISGVQAPYDITTGTYSIAGLLSFKITRGVTSFAVGDAFTFFTTRDPGLEIKDLLVDEGNDRLYAVTYFWGPLEPHAVGNVYSIGLNAGNVPVGSWSETTSGLPQYDPPDDATLFAQHALASNVPPWQTGGATALYIGGEGINLYKATSGIGGGAPLWNPSKNGLTNLVMARMPILFSGICSMGIQETNLGDNLYVYTIYIEDSNGNPPISGSEFTVTLLDADGKLLSTALKVSYSDVYTHQGTFRDPTDITTDRPYTLYISFTGAVAEAKFSFVPTCDGTKVPGCSGSEQNTSYFH